MTRRRLAAAFSLGISLPISAFAEISDKMSSQSWLWGQGIVLGVVAIALGVWRPWWALLPALVGLVLLLAAWGDAHDPMFAPYLLAQVGPTYTPVTYVTSLIPVLIAAAIIGRHVWRRRKGGLPPNKSLERTREG
jgi:hypothetical protein